MSSISVKLKNVDESDRYIYRARSIKIRISSSQSFETPVRAVTNTEMNAKASVPAEIPIDAEVGEVVVKLTSPKVSNSKRKERDVLNFITHNKVYDRVNKSIQYQLLSMRYFPLRIVLVQPTNTALNYLHDAGLNQKFLRIVLDLQLRLGLDLITVPWLKLNPSEIKKIYLSFSNNFPNKELVFFLSPEDNKLLTEYLKIIDEIEDIKFIGLLYKKIDTHKPAYDSLWEYTHDRDIAVLLSNVKRDGDIPFQQNLSVIHYAEFIVGDVISREVPIPAPSGDTYDMLKTKFFEKLDLTLRNIVELSQNIGWVEKISKVLDNENSVIQALENYEEAKNDRDKLNVINSISKIHEFKESREEFITSRKYIEKNESMEYIQSKNTLKKLFLQPSLSGWF